MAPRTRKAAAPPPSVPEPTVLDWLKRELLIAISVAASLTVVLVVRRWATELLGQGVLNQDVFAGNAAIQELVGRVEERFTRGEAVHGAPEPQPRRPRTHRPADDAADQGGPDDDDHNG